MHEETLKTLRLVHLTLLGLSGAVAILIRPDYSAYHANALVEVETVRSLIRERYASYYAHCDRVAQRLAEDKSAQNRVRVERLLRTLGGSVVLAKGAILRPVFAFCDGPPTAGTLEAYDRFFREKQTVWVAQVTDDGLLKALSEVARRAAEEHDRIEIDSITCQLQRQINESTPDRQRELLRNVHSLEGSSAVYGRDGLLINVSWSKGGVGDACDFGCAQELAAPETTVGADWFAEMNPALVRQTLAGPVFLPSVRPFWPTVRDFSLDEAYRYLQREARGQERNVSLLGLPLNATAVPWAPPLMMLLTLWYLHAHLRHLLGVTGRSGQTKF